MSSVATLPIGTAMLPVATVACASKGSVPSNGVVAASHRDRRRRRTRRCRPRRCRECQESPPFSGNRCVRQPGVGVRFRSMSATTLAVMKPTCALALQVLVLHLLEQGQVGAPHGAGAADGSAEAVQVRCRQTRRRPSVAAGDGAGDVEQVGVLTAEGRETGDGVGDVLVDRCVRPGTVVVGERASRRSTTNRSGRPSRRARSPARPAPAWRRPARPGRRGSARER